MAESDFMRGVDRANREIQQMMQMRGSQQRGTYVQDPLGWMEEQEFKKFKRQQIRGAEKRRQEFVEAISPEEEETIGGEIGMASSEAMAAANRGDYRLLTNELFKVQRYGEAVSLMGRMPTELQEYEAQTRRMAAEPKPPQPKLPTPSMYEYFPMGKGMEQRYRFNPETRKHDIPVGKPRPIFKPTQQATAEDKQMTVVREIGQIFKRFGGDIDLYAMALMTPTERNKYLRGQATDVMKRVKEPHKTRLRQLYKKLEQITNEIVGPLPKVAPALPPADFQAILEEAKSQFFSGPVPTRKLTNEEMTAIGELAMQIARDRGYYMEE